jgi:hypothetical protein
MSASRNTKNKPKNMKKYNEYRVALTEFIANPSKDTLAALRKIEYTQSPCCPKKSYDADSDPTANCERCLIRQPIDNLESMCLLCYIDDTEIDKKEDPVAAALVAALMLQPIFEGNDAEPREKEA